MANQLNALNLASLAVANGDSTSEADGSLVWSTSLSAPMMALGGAWRLVTDVLNTDGNPGRRIYVGTTAPPSPAIGDVWIH